MRESQSKNDGVGRIAGSARPRKSWRAEIARMLLFVFLTAPVSAIVGAPAAGEGAGGSAKGNVPETAPGGPVSEEAAGKQATATVRKMLAAVRLKKYDYALKFVGVEEMTRFLMDRHFDKLSQAERTRFRALLGSYIKKRGFPLATRYIGSVGLSYDRPLFKDGRVHIKSSIVYSGAERLVFTWILQKAGSEYRVVDFLNADGESSLSKSRDTQILPVYQKLGARGMLDKLEGAVSRL